MVGYIVLAGNNIDCHPRLHAIILIVDQAIMIEKFINSKEKHMLNEHELEDNERFFRDPTAGEELLKPPSVGTACSNIRKALHLLGYPVSRGEQYDEQLVKAVRQFQLDQHHTETDGYVGPGTRRLLVKIVAQRSGKRGFAHMRDPERELKKKLQAPIIKDIERKSELIEKYKEHLHLLELQAAKFGSLMSPPHLQTGIKETKEIIENLKREIADLNKQIE